MKFAATSFAFIVLVVPSASFGADVIHPTAMPRAGKAGLFTGRVSDFSGISSALTGKAAGAVLAGYKSSPDIVRGGVEAALYRRISPAVVLVVTDAELGSGSLISNDGQILTNYHVVKGYLTAGIFLKPQREGVKPSPSEVITADVVKVDPTSDLALLKMRSVPNIAGSPVSLGDFSKVSVGDDVNAIGHPEGETWTYTKGYVSQIRVGYEWKGEDGVAHKADVIQTQTPINPGNSGGPLLNNKGLLIGVNAFKEAQGENLNFAIGVDTVQSFLHNQGSTAQAAEVPSKCEPRQLFQGRTKTNDGSVTQFDLKCSGQVNLAIVLPDDPAKPMEAFIDMSGTGKIQGVVFSNHRDGIWNFSLWDTKGNGLWDVIGYHPDGKIVPSSYGPYTGNR